MIEKFDSYEEAALFIEEKRAEGYLAEFRNEGVGFLWGPRTVGGFRVYVSDEPVPEDLRDELQEELERRTTAEDTLPTRIIRGVVLFFLAIGLLAGIVSALASLNRSLSLLIGIAIVLVISVVGGYFVFRKDFPQPPEE